MSKEKEFHKSRIIFVIKDEEVFVNKYTEMSHEEWFREMGWLAQDDSIINNNIRGYYDGTGIYIYYGYDFKAPDKDLVAQYIDRIVEKLEITDTNIPIYLGTIPQEIGNKWPPREKLGSIRYFKRKITRI